MPIGRIILAICLSATAVQGADDPAALCDRAAQLAASTSAVPLDILLAITRAETGRRRDGQFSPWPWAINDGGQGFWFGSEEEAKQAAADRLAAGDDNFDIGCFQINAHWHAEGFTTFDAMFDPDENARYAAHFLTSLYQEAGDWNAAIGAYHSRTPDLAASYLSHVNALRGQPTAQSDQPVLAVAEPPHPNLFPLLQSGAQGGAGSLVPRQSGLAPLFDDRG